MTRPESTPGLHRVRALEPFGDGDGDLQDHRSGQWAALLDQPCERVPLDKLHADEGLTALFVQRIHIDQIPMLELANQAGLTRQVQLLLERDMAVSDFRNFNATGLMNPDGPCSSARNTRAIPPSPSSSTSVYRSNCKGNMSDVMASSATSTVRAASVGLDSTMVS